MGRKSYIKRYIILIIVAILILGIIIYALLFEKSNNIEQKKQSVTKNSSNIRSEINSEENIKNYEEEIELNEASIVLDYNTFYTLEGIIKEIIYNIEQQKYDIIYKSIDDNFTLSKGEFYAILKAYSEAIYSSYGDVKYLVKAYKQKENIYDCEFELQGYRQSITIKLNEKDTKFIIIDIDKWGYVDD